MLDLKIFAEIANAYRLVKEVIKDIQERHRQSVDIEIDEHTSDSYNLSQRYQVALGKRHEFLRTKVLNLTEREMSDFYGYEKVSLLINCELGKDEFPTASIKKLIDTFFIERKYIEEGEGCIFQTFDVISSQNDCKKFLTEGFSPTFLCDPDFDKTGEVRLTFHKVEKERDRELSRAIVSNGMGCFYSNGGGYHNVKHFIDAMLDTDYDSYISFVNVDSPEWDRLNRGSWYKKGFCGYAGKSILVYPGKANHKAGDKFGEWVDYVKKSRYSLR